MQNNPNSIGEKSQTSGGTRTEDSSSRAATLFCFPGGKSRPLSAEMTKPAASAAADCVHTTYCGHLGAHPFHLTKLCL